MLAFSVMTRTLDDTTHAVVFTDRDSALRAFATALVNPTIASASVLEDDGIDTRVLLRYPAPAVKRVADAKALGKTPVVDAKTLEALANSTDKTKPAWVVFRMDSPFCATRPWSVISTFTRRNRCVGRYATVEQAKRRVRDLNRGL